MEAEPTEKKERVVLKLIVLGCSNVGKSALIKRYATGKYTDLRVATIGSDFMTKIIDLMGLQVVLQIWDTAGQERFHQGTIGTPFYRGANGCLLVYDVTNEKSIEQLSQWRDELMNRIDITSNFPIVVVGNKTDLRNELNTVDQTEVLKWCRDNGYGHVETSAKDDFGVQAAVIAVAALALEHRKEISRLGSGERPISVVRISERYSKPSNGCCR
jgi:Ras-related protein Rab-7A